MLLALSIGKHAPSKKRGKTCTRRQARENTCVTVGKTALFWFLGAFVLPRSLDKTAHFREHRSNAKLMQILERRSESQERTIQ